MQYLYKEMKTNLLNRIGLPALMALMLFTSCCRKNPPTATVKLKLSHAVDLQPLISDTLIYQNQAGEWYSVNRLQYYISGIRFSTSAGDSVSVPGIWYIDAFDPTTLQLSLPAILQNQYSKLSFFIGLSPSENISNSLTPTLENVNMAWPEFMGGGYHFMKWEGMVKPDTTTSGFAVHLGNNLALVHCSVQGTFDLKSESTQTIYLKMNLNEWLRNPVVYSFKNDGNYTMGDSVLMTTIAKNGADVFTQQ